MTTATKVKFRLALVFIVLLYAIFLAGLVALGSTSTRARHHRHHHKPLPTYGYYNMATLGFTMQQAWNQQALSQGSHVTVRVTCTRVLIDTAVCHIATSNNQSADIGVQITQHGNAYKLSQVR